MRVFQIVLFILAMLIITTQAFRHVYVRFLEPRTSVLEKYDQTETEKAIKKAQSLDELLTMYDPAKKVVDELNKQKTKEEENKTKDELDLFREKFDKIHEKEYARESDLRYAIQDWEHKSKQIYELRVFWAFGLALCLIGTLFILCKRPWFGMSFIIPGAVEMIWWTSPSLGFGGCPLEYDRLLINKLVFTLITFLLIIIWWCLTGKIRSEQKPLA
jgi:hypothetical protein